MKYFLISVLTLLIILIGNLIYWTGIETHYRVQCQYEICWPDTTMKYDTIFNCVHNNADRNLLNARTTSSRGTNYLRIDPGYNNVVATTAPIRLISFKKVD